MFLGLEKDTSFAIAKTAIETLNSKGNLSTFSFGNTSIAMDKKSAMSNALSLIMRNFKTDETVKKYIDEEEFSIVCERVSDYQISGNYEENQFFAILYMIEDHLVLAYERKDMEANISALFETAKYIDSTTAQDNLTKENPSIEWAINEIVTTLRQKIRIAYGKEVPENLKKRCTIIIGLADNIRDSLNHNDNTSIFGDIQKFCSIAQNIQKSINNNNDYHLTSGETRLLDSKAGGKDMNNDRTPNERALAKRNELAVKAQTARQTELIEKPTNTSLQRVPVEGTTEEPIATSTKFKKYIIGGVAVLVAAATGIMIWVTSKSDKKTTDFIDEEHKKIVEDLHNNWSESGINISEEQTRELYTLINSGVSETMNVDDMEEILASVADSSVTPAINNLLNGESNEVKTINVSSLILEGTEGLTAVKKMESYLNGCIEDPDKIEYYCEQAFIQEACLIGEGETIEGLNLTEDTTNAPSVRLIWARLAQGVNAFAGTLGSDFTVEVNGKTYTQSELNNSNALADIAAAAKAEMGSAEKTFKK